MHIQVSRSNRIGNGKSKHLLVKMDDIHTYTHTHSCNAYWAVSECNPVQRTVVECNGTGCNEMYVAEYDGM